MLDVDRIQAEVGDTVELANVLMLGGDGDMQVGTPTVDGARVTAEVLEHGRDRKILVFKYKNKTRYRRRHGHRQGFTRLAIRQILLRGEELAPVAERPAAAVEEAPGTTEEVKPKRTPRRKAVAKEQPPEAAPEVATKGAEAPKATPAARARRRKQAEVPATEAAAEAEARVSKPARPQRRRQAEAPAAEAAAEPEAQAIKPARGRRPRTPKPDAAPAPGETSEQTEGE